MKECFKLKSKALRSVLNAGKAMVLFAGLLYTGAQSAQAQCSSGATTIANSKCFNVALKGNTVALNNNSTGNCVTYTDYTYLPSPDLTAGNKYDVYVQQGTCGTENARSINVWIDFNRNNVFDASEVLGGAGSVANATANLVVKFSFQLPCNVVPGNARMRVIVLEGSTNSAPCGTYSAGETEDYIVRLQTPGVISAAFTYPSQVFVNTATTFIATARNNSAYSWDADINGYEVSPIPPDFRFTWNTTGLKCVKLKSTNCVGTDSTTNCFNVINPTKVPTADFVASATAVEEVNPMQLFDLSSDGPTAWKWEAYDSSNLSEIKDESSGDVQWLTSKTGQNPKVQFITAGCYTIVLTATNSVGSSAKKRKVCYIKVTPTTDFFLSFGLPYTESPTGRVFDDKGPSANYTTANSNPGVARLRITPCNAKKINLTFTQIKMNKADHVVKIYDAPYADPARLIYTASNIDRTRLPFTVTALSGSMYVTFDATSGGVDSGFAAYFNSELAPATAPIPGFTMNSYPSYNRVKTKHTNTTTNIAGRPVYTWYIDDDAVTDPTALVENPDGSGRVDLYYQYLSDGPYNVCLEVASCVGIVKQCEVINVVTPNSPTQLDFIASNLRPTMGDDVDMTAISDKADKFLWTIYPSNAFTLVSGGTLVGPGVVSGQNPKLKFNAPGKFSFALTAWNTNDSAGTTNTVVKGQYVVVLSYCEPVGNILSADLATSRVLMTDASSNVLLNSVTGTGLDDYTNYTSTVNPVNLAFGSKYTLSVFRNTAVDPATRKVWIDFNVDGDFDDPKEEIMTELSAYTLSNTVVFSVPAIPDALDGNTRMRVATTYANNPATPCGPFMVGEYEDYAIRIIKDNTSPVITLNGPDTIRFQQCFPYIDELATAYDPVQGDVTDDIVVTTDLVDSCIAGIYTVEFNVQDAAGNKATPVTRTVIVVIDKTPPVLTVGGANPYYIEANRENPPYTEPGLVTAVDNAKGDITPAILTTGSVNTRELGTYTITYTVRDGQGNADTATRTVIVRDTKAPSIIEEGSLKVQINGQWADQTMAFDSFDNAPVLTATPGYAGAVNPFKKGKYPVNYTATDQSNNSFGPIQRVYEVDDYIAPVILFKGDKQEVYYHNVNTPYQTEKPSRSDNYYDTSSVSLILTNPNVVNPFALGTYKEVWRAQDPSGNITLATRTVHVVDREAPTIFAPPIKACVESPINPWEGVNTTDNYYGPDVLNPLIEVVYNNVNQWVQGNYQITYRVTDPSGNQSVLFTRTVEYTAWPNCMNSLNVKNISAEDAVTVYPNPNSGKFTLDMKAVSGDVNVQVYNTLGELVATHTASSSRFDMDLTGFATGMYLLKIYNNDNVFTKKVTVNR